MKIILATGIYSPDIGGPATYVLNLAQELKARGHRVVVVTYAAQSSQEYESERTWELHRVSRRGGPLLRWRRYARVLKKVGHDADIVYAFSSVSCGVPLACTRLRAKKVLRLGGDFAWERYTDRGGQLSLRAWYASRPRVRRIMALILRSFDHIVFSTAFQRSLTEEHYTSLPPRSVIENALPIAQCERHERHMPFRLLSLGRFVAFKSLSQLLGALTALPTARLSVVGDGPKARALQRQTRELGLQDRVTFFTAVKEQSKATFFSEHDLLVIPSLTEISPNTALEARAAGLPVLLTAENGLSDNLRQGMIVRDLSGAQKIAAAIKEIQEHYDGCASQAATISSLKRGWSEVAEETVQLFSTLVSAS